MMPCALRKKFSIKMPNNFLKFKKEGRRLFLMGFALLVSFHLSRGEEAGFVPLFNGTDLSGWVNVNCAPDTWRATNGVIYCTGAPIGELRTTRMYQNFVFE